MATNNATKFAGLIAVVGLATIAAPGLGTHHGAPPHADSGIDMPHVTEPRVADPPNAAELEDLQTIANQEGIDLTAAITEFGWQDNFSLMVNTIRASSPDSFSGAAIEGPASAWVAFTNDVDRDVQDALAAFRRAFPEVVVGIVTDRGFTQTQLDRAVQAVHQTIREATLTSQITTVSDAESGSITTTLPRTMLPSDMTIEQLEDIGRNSLGEHRAISFDIVVSDSSILHGSESHYGGEALETLHQLSPSSRKGL